MGTSVGGMGGVANMAQGFGGIMQMGQAADLAVQGANLQAASYRQAAGASLAAANYNAAINRINRDRQLDATSRQIMRIGATQRTQAAMSGFTGTSKSFLSVMNATLAQFERQVVDVRNTAKQKEEAILFEGRAQAAQFENQARAAEFQGQIAAFNIQSRQSQQMGSLLGGLFGG